MPDDIPNDRAVLDRIEDGRTAVLLVGPSEELRHLPADALPAGAEEGTWLVVNSDGSIGDVDVELTRARAASISARMQRIRGERGRGRFGR